jgi:hypothetical protein
MIERRYDIDWLRVLVMMAVFLFHCARFFGGGTWHLNNAAQSIAAWLFIGWLDIWFMPLFFLLSGFGSWYALKHRSNSQYIWERFKRLMVPLYTVGLFLMIPPQFYFEISSNSGYTDTFWKSYNLYLNELLHLHIRSPGGLLPPPFNGHLWFLKYLFLISLLALPLLRFLRSEQGLRLTGRLAEWCDLRGGFFIFLLPIILLRVGLRSFFQGDHTWADFFEFVIYFAIGYIFSANSRFTESMKKHGLIYLTLGLAGYVCEGIFVFGIGYNYPGDEPFSLKFVLFETMMSISRWSWIVLILCVGATYLNYNKKFLEYGKEAVLPFYIFHQTVILCTGWFVIQWNMGILPKFLIIAVISFASIMFLYEFLVRRINVLRFLFGMRLKIKP